MRVRLHRFTSGLALVFLAVSSAAIAAEPADDPNRWDLRDLFPNVSAWNAERNEVED